MFKHQFFLDEQGLDVSSANFLPLHGIFLDFTAELYRTYQLQEKSSNKTNFKKDELLWRQKENNFAVQQWSIEL